MGMPAAGFEKVRLPLVDRAATDLARTCERSQLSATDIVNRAISLYEFIDEERASGTEVLLRRANGTTVVIQLM